MFLWEHNNFFLEKTGHIIRSVTLGITLLLFISRGFSIPTGTPSNVQSPLSTGELFVIEIEQTGVYELTGTWLQSNFGRSFENVPLSNIHIYGIAGGPLNENSIYTETERLTQIPFYIVDDGDERLAGADKIIFYGEGPSVWRRSEDGNFKFIKNPYSTTARFIIKIGNEDLTIVEKELAPAPTNTINTYRYLEIYHEDQINLLGAEVSNQGSGQVWYGPNISNESTLDVRKYLNKISPSLNDAHIELGFAGRSSSNEQVSLTVDGQSLDQGIRAVNTGDVEELYARNTTISMTSEILSPNTPIELNYTRNNTNAQLWIDYIQLEGSTEIENTQGFIFNNENVIGTATDGIIINNPDASTIWDVTDPLAPVKKEVFEIGSSEFSIYTDNQVFSNYIIFYPEATFPAPVAAGTINNQNIYNIDFVDLLIIYPEGLASSAFDLAQHRRTFSNIEVVTVSLDQILNEYGAGRMDPTAIRNYIRDLYNLGTGIQNVLLFGDASYDYRNITPLLPDENLIPTYETKESLDPLLAFPSDDYFALLDDGEGGNLRGDLDVGVGRLTIRNLNEAQTVVEKIINYDLSSFGGPWKSQIAFMADDEDNNLHLNDADRIAREVANNFPVFNQSKIYLDAFVQESTPGGNRYPSATSSLNRTVNEGALILNYLGHGGPRGWSQERVLKIDDITSWTNTDRLPLVITATCSFTGFDDPALTTAGESVLLQPGGGGIALFTTVRSVYASKNFRLTRAVFRNIFGKENGKYLTIGEVMRRAKNDIPNDNTNARKFFLIGDPSMRLSIPNYDVTTLVINNKNTSSSEGVIDTVGALDLVLLQGQIENQDGILNDDFNGSVDIIVYDKPTEVFTLGNDQGSSITSYTSQENIIFRGKADVNNGIFQIEFRVPVDIDYNFGIAKISYFAESKDGFEALGANEQLVISGTSEMPIVDLQGPDINVYLNNRRFNSGDRVGPNNLAIIDLSDASGINLSTAAIGHEITATLDDGNPMILNELYEPSAQDPDAGTVLFDLLDLGIGEHTLTVKAFDVANNVSEETITFEVVEDIDYDLDSVILFPVPTTGKLQVKMNSDIRGSKIEMELEIYNAAGQLIETLTENPSFDGETYQASFDLAVRSSQALFVKATLIDQNSGVRSRSVLKKTWSLK